MFGALQLSGTSRAGSRTTRTCAACCCVRGAMPSWCAWPCSRFSASTTRAVAADELLLDRAQRIVEALEAAGVGTADQLRAIGGNARRRFRARRAAGGAVSGRLAPLRAGRAGRGAEPRPGVAGTGARSPSPNRSAMPSCGSSCLSAAATWPARRRVIAAAWRANPRRRCSAAVRRLGQGAATRWQRRCAPGPPSEANLDPVELALAYVVAAIRVPRPEWDAGEIPRLAAPVLAATALPPPRCHASVLPQPSRGW